MKTISLITLLVLFPILSKSQISPGRKFLSDVIDPSMINTELFYNGKYKEISGSPFLEKELQNGTIILNDDRKVENVLIRYNAYEDALLYQIAKDQITMLDPPVIKGFEFQPNDRNVKFISISIIEGKKHFYEVIYDGKSTLVVRHQIKLTNKTNNAGSYGANDMQGSAFKKLETYFLLDATGKIFEISLTKKSLTSALGSHEEELKAFIKENKLKVREKIDLATLLEYYDSLE